MRLFPSLLFWESSRILGGQFCCTCSSLGAARYLVFAFTPDPYGQLIKTDVTINLQR